MSLWNFLSLDKAPQVYLDHNATTPIAKEVLAAMTEVAGETFGNPSSLHTCGRESRGIVDRSRETIASLLGCPTDSILFTSGGTEGNNAVIKGVFGAFGKGHIITSRIEHESIIGACRQIETLGGRVTRLNAFGNGQVNPEELLRAITPETILISIMHANNETGIIQPVETIGKIAKARGILFHTDAVQTFGKIRTKVNEIACDFLTLTAHKINGPKGAGALYIRNSARFIPLIFGGDQEGSLRAGTEGTHQIRGLAKAAELADARMDEEFRRLKRLRHKLMSGVKQLVPSVIFNQTTPPWQLPGTVNLTFPGMSGLRILAGLDCYGVGVSIGSACTADRIEPSHVLLGMGISEEHALSSIRVSMGCTTGMLEVVYFLWVLKHILAGDPAGFSYLDPKHLTEEKISSPNSFLIDLRLPHERFLAPSLSPAKEWRHIGFERYFREIPWDKEVILMCGTGVFSLGAGYRLAHAGHPNVRVVFGGYVAWKSLHPSLFQKYCR